VLVKTQNTFQVFFLFLGGRQANSIGPLVPKQKLWRLLKIEGSVLMYIVPPLGPTYIGERRTTFAKAYGIKVRCLNGEHIGNPLGT